MTDRPRHIAFLGTLRVPANPPRTHERVYYRITIVIHDITLILLCNSVYITCIQISWRVLGQGSKTNPRLWRGLVTDITASILPELQGGSLKQISAFRNYFPRKKPQECGGKTNCFRKLVYTTTSMRSPSMILVLVILMSPLLVNLIRHAC